MSVEVGYYRRIWQNFPVVDNVLASASDFQQFNVTVPTDARLPGGGGNQLTYYNINPNKVGPTGAVLSQLYNTLSDKYGDEYEHWNGVDVSLSGRLQNGLRFQAGTSTGHTVADNCAVIAKVPEMLTNGPANAGGTAAAGPQLAQQFCHLAEPWLTNFKALVFYTLPKVDVQLAVTFRSVPGLTNTNGNGAGGVQPSGLAGELRRHQRVSGRELEPRPAAHGHDDSDAEHDAADHQSRHGLSRSRQPGGFPRRQGLQV